MFFSKYSILRTTKLIGLNKSTIAFSTKVSGFISRASMEYLFLTLLQLYRTGGDELIRLRGGKGKEEKLGCKGMLCSAYTYMVWLWLIHFHFFHAEK